MIKVEFLGPIGKTPLKVDVQNLQELADLLKQDNEVASWLGNCAVAVNDKLVSSRDLKLNDGDKVSLLPPVCGG